MPRLRVIVLDQKTAGQWQYIMWADVPVGRQTFYLNSSVTSLWKNALPSDIANLQSGAMVEQVGRINTPGFTPAQLETELENRWQQFQTDINALNLWNFYGTNWNGTVWTSTGAN